ncbi:sugar ABC transporter permease [Paenibacillus thermotolerans]|uniref:sugar ABC transporter permease n=1 Tax=Paenibacillus thermotolerans TaxID=3027807 RepID=UPI0023681977|nr:MULTISPECIES: sugar ABC transporter permease [unclassified Paenibacillus]
MNKTRNAMKLTLSYILLAIITIMVLYPTLWIVMSSFKVGSSLFSTSLIPDQFTLQHYKDLFADRANKDFRFVQWYFNTIKVATISMLIGTLIQLLTAYAISRYRFYGRKALMSTILVLGMFPGFMSMIAVYIILIQLNLLGTHWALILVYSAGAALGMFVAKGYFDTLPKALEESARIDGAGHLTIFFRIFLPLSRPIMTYVALTTFSGAWVDYIFARLILSKARDQWTLAVGLVEMVDSYSSTEFTLFAAGSVLAAIPVALLFMGLQRLLVQGLTAGATKG